MYKDNIFKFLLVVFLLSLTSLVFAGPPGFPHAFYGDVLVNGESAIDGYEVSAIVENGTTITNLQNPILTFDGSYGLHQDKYLLVQGENLSGEISFYVNGVLADQTSTFVYDGGPTELDLSVTIDNEDDEDDDSGSSSDDDDDDSSSSSSSSSTDSSTEDDLYTTNDLDNSEVDLVLQTININDEFNINTQSEDLNVTLVDEIESIADLDLSNIDNISSKLDLENQKKIENLKSAIQNTNQNNLEITANIKTYKIESNDGSEIYRSKVELKIKANKDLEEVIYIQEIPKELAIDVSQIIFNIPPSEILLDDPIVKWDFSSLSVREVKDISYFVKKKVDDLTINNFISIVSAKEVNRIEDDDSQENIFDELDDSNEFENLEQDNDQKSSDNSWLVVSLVGILVVVFVLLIFNKNKKKKLSYR